jgi:hypothetical protein
MAAQPLQPGRRDWRSQARGPAFTETPLAAGIAVACSLAAGLAVAHLPSFVAAGANLSDPAQADYARNLWASTAIARAAVAALCPLVAYGLLPPHIVGARKVSLAISLVGLCIALGFAVDGLNAYGKPPVPVNGAVTSFQGREISQCGFPSHHLLISDSELRQARTWVNPGAAVLLYLTPNGDAAYLGRAQADWPCVTSALGS